ncbi:helix-turn-helix domain-containing protein [Plantibacter sp.]|uniref:helix-turn-helix domain-containing protein n=1 Tax=Plantibacter sp. TaxID=1871045 RepID=UPI0039C8C8E2
MSTLVTSPKLLKVPEAARRLRVRRETVYRWIAAGKLEAFRLGESGPLRIPASAIDAHLRRVAPAVERGTNVAHPAAGDGAARRQGQSLQGQP